MMKNAPDRLYVSANLATGFSELFAERKYLAFPTKSINFQSPYEINGSAYNATLGDFPTDRVQFTPRNPAPNLIGGLALGNRFFKNRLGLMLAGSYQNTLPGQQQPVFRRYQRGRHRENRYAHQTQ